MLKIPGIPYIYKLFWIDIQVWYFPFKTIKFSNSQLLHCKTEMIQIRVIPNFFVHPAFTKRACYQFGICTFSAYFLYLCTNSNNFWHVYSMYKIKKIPQTTFFDFAVLRFSAVFRRFLPTQWVSKDCPFSLHDTETF